jgi:hypothetical protein
MVSTGTKMPGERNSIWSKGWKTNLHKKDGQDGRNVPLKQVKKKKAVFAWSHFSTNSSIPGLA